jgi:hypothetical protein
MARSMRRRHVAEATRSGRVIGPALLFGAGVGLGVGAAVATAADDPATPAETEAAGAATLLQAAPRAAQVLDAPAPAPDAAATVRLPDGRTFTTEPGRRYAVPVGALVALPSGLTVEGMAPGPFFNPSDRSWIDFVAPQVVPQVAPAPEVAPAAAEDAPEEFSDTTPPSARTALGEPVAAVADRGITVGVQVGSTRTQVTAQVGGAAPGAGAATVTMPDGRSFTTEPGQTYSVPVGSTLTTPSGVTVPLNEPGPMQNIPDGSRINVTTP